MSSRTKGRKHEKEVEALLLKEGYQVELVKGSSKFNKSVDFFGLFDGLAVSKKDCIFFQVKTNLSIKSGGKSKLLTDITKFKKTTPLNGCFKFRIYIRYTKPELKKKWGKFKVIDI